MGWLYVNKEPGVTAREYLSKELEWENKHMRQCALDGAVVNFREGYFAVEQTNTDGSREVYALIYLLNYCPKSYYNFGYKSMHESAGPYMYNCPERILKLLTPTDSKWANGWREKCWERIRQAKARPRLKKGLIIQFETPISFINGMKESVFQVENARRLLLKIWAPVSLTPRFSDSPLVLDSFLNVKRGFGTHWLKWRYVYENIRVALVTLGARTALTSTQLRL